MKCPVCGNENLYTKNYHEEVGLVESVTRCDECEQFEENWAYGKEFFILKDKRWVFTDHGYMDEVSKIEAKKNWEEIVVELNKCEFYDGEYDLEED